MTSNAEEQANLPAAAMLQPPKTTKRAHVMRHSSAALRPVSQGRERKASSAERRPKSQRAAKQAKPATGAREGSKAAKVLSLLSRPGRRFVERANESYRLVGAFCPWVSQPHGKQEDEAQARVCEERRWGAPIYRPKVGSHNPSKQRAAGLSSAAFPRSFSGSPRVSAGRRLTHF
jgi:hypothetical protein